MDEVLDFCTRVLGPGQLAVEASCEAGQAGSENRVEALAAAAQACRARADGLATPTPAVPREKPVSLGAAVAAELAAASARLAERQREALALREALGLSHAEIAAVMRMERTAVAPLMARARLGLRAERRGTPAEDPARACGERDRALRLLALRQDGEPPGPDDNDWLHDHLGLCPDCRGAHAAMLEASACYRAWRVEDVGTETVSAAAVQ